MRLYVAPILALFILTIACADPLFCADGCDRDGVTTTDTTQTGANCPTCLSSVEPQHDAPIVGTELVTQVPEQIATTPVSPFRTDVDHPPRLT